MKKILLLLALIYFNNTFAQSKKELVYRVDGSIVSNSSGSSFHPFSYVFQDAYNQSRKQNESGNFNPNNDFFYVYAAPDIDLMLKAQNDEITQLKAELADLKNSLAKLKSDVHRLKQQHKAN